MSLRSPLIPPSRLALTVSELTTTVTDLRARAAARRDAAAALPVEAAQRKTGQRGGSRGGNFLSRHPHTVGMRCRERGTFEVAQRYFPRVVDWVALAESGTVQTSLGALLALAGGWAAESHTRRLRRADQAAAHIEQSLDVVDEQAWGLIQIVRLQRKPGREHVDRVQKLHRAVLAAASACAASPGPHREARRSLGHLLRGLTHELNLAMVGWSRNRSERDRERAAHVLGAISASIGRWRWDPASLSRETVGTMLAG